MGTPTESLSDRSDEAISDASNRCDLVRPRMVITELPTETGDVTRDAAGPNLYTGSTQRAEEITVGGKDTGLATNV